MSPKNNQKPNKSYTFNVPNPMILNNYTKIGIQDNKYIMISNSSIDTLETLNAEGKRSPQSKNVEAILSSRSSA